MAKQRSHNEWFGRVARGGRKSCPHCLSKLAEGESIWSWGVYHNAKFRRIMDVCKQCWHSVRGMLTEHTAGCGCTVNLCARSGDGPLPKWMTLDVPESPCPVPSPVPKPVEAT